MEHAVNHRAGGKNASAGCGEILLFPNAVPGRYESAADMSVTTFSQPPGPLRIFVVENHPDTLMYLQMYLEVLGHKVASARTIKDALSSLTATEYDVLISDIGLPDGSGWELLPRVHAGAPRPIFAIAMSGFGLSADHERSREAGFRHHLLKPFRPDELNGMLQEAALEMAAAR